MGELISKDELVQLLKKGLIEEFNRIRLSDKDNQLDLSEIDLKILKLPELN